jgi:two-component system, cell cycle sensor histidine kinase and response regulator CckA
MQSEEDLPRSKAGGRRDMPVFIPESEEGRHRQLLEKIILAILGAGIAGQISMCFLTGASQPVTESDVFITRISLIIMGVLAGLLVLNRIGYYRKAAAMTVLATSLGIYMVALYEPGAENSWMLSYLAVPLLIGSLFLSRCWLFALMLFNLAAMLSLPAVYAGLQLQNLPVIFNTAVALLILIGMRHRQRVEAGRRQELAQSEERYRRLVDDSADVVFRMGDESVFTFLNLAVHRITGYEPEELVGAPLEAVVAPEDRDKVRLFLTAQHHKPDETQPLPLELNCVRKDGTVFPAELRVMTLGEEARPGLPEIQGILRDTSLEKAAAREKRHIEEQMQQTQKLESLGVLAGGIAHDFNNLLMTIAGNTDLAMLECAGDVPVRKYLAEISSAADHAAGLVSQILAYAGKDHFVMAAIDLSAISRDMSQMLRVSISKKARLHHDFAEKLPAAAGNAARLRQIIMNLITNASDALGGQGGDIYLRTGTVICNETIRAQSRTGGGPPDGPCVFFEVRDTGCGMDEETLQRIFDPFYTTKVSGRGLGLAAATGIIRSHNGALIVESRKGAGSTFRVLLPALAYGVKETERTLDTIMNESRENKGRILIADDEKTILAIARQILEKAGFEAATAADGAEAVRMFSRAPASFDCVLLDLTMPNMSGIEVLEKIHALRPDIPVILSSGYNAPDENGDLKEKGFAGFIQ